MPARGAPDHRLRLATGDIVILHLTVHFASNRATAADVRNLTAAALATLSNKVAIAINQDAAAHQPRVVAKKNGAQVRSHGRHCHFGSK